MERRSLPNLNLTISGRLLSELYADYKGAELPESRHVRDLLVKRMKEPMPEQIRVSLTPWAARHLLTRAPELEMRWLAALKQAREGLVRERDKIFYYRGLLTALNKMTARIDAYLREA